jgi:hypothetical protein
MLPEALRPTSIEEFRIAELQTVGVPKATPVFQPWRGSPLSDTYGGKPVLEFGGEPLFAELVILRHFQLSGWQGVWFDTYRNRTLIGLDVPGELPPGPRSLLSRIFEQAGSSGGCFDVIAWRDEVVAFAEAKQAGRDRVRETQIRWVAAALAVGVPLASLLVVEWSFPKPLAA